MEDIIRRIKEDVEKKLVRSKAEKRETLLYIDHEVFEQGKKLNIVLSEIEFDRPTYLVFVDEAPGMNWAHPCHYLLYDAENGKFLKRIDAEFPYFLQSTPKTLELFRTCRTVEEFRRKKPIRMPLEPGKLSAWSKFAKLPLAIPCAGRRFAILFSGSSNCRHVNDMEFLYRTLIDVYGYHPDNIYVLNYDGTINWNPAGTWEPTAPCNYPVDGTPFRMHINGQGNRTGFQNVISDLSSRIGSGDCLFIHTNNHGGWSSSQNQGYMSAWGGVYYANDFASDLALLPKFYTLLVMMEPCHAGAFNHPIITSSPADRTVAQAAVPWNESSAGDWPFDPWAEMWISAMAGVRGDGSALAVSPDDNMDTRTSAWEAFDYALHIDNPVMEESVPNISKNIFLSRCGYCIKPIKEYIKDFKPINEFKVKDIYEGIWTKGYAETPEFRIPRDFVRDELYGLEARLTRLETMFERLAPFIDSRMRPDLEGSAYRQQEEQKRRR
jgi:hypothetical protein